MKKETIKRIEEKSRISFYLLKKDLLALSDKISQINLQIDFFNKELKKIEQKINRKRNKIKKRKALLFFDLKKRKKFKTKKYTYKRKNNKVFAVAKAPSGTFSWRILGKRNKDKS